MDSSGASKGKKKKNEMLRSISIKWWMSSGVWKKKHYPYIHFGLTLALYPEVPLYEPVKVGPVSKQYAQTNY